MGAYTFGLRLIYRHIPKSADNFIVLLFYFTSPFQALLVSNYPEYRRKSKAVLLLLFIPVSAPNYRVARIIRQTAQMLINGSFGLFTAKNVVLYVAVFLFGILRVILNHWHLIEHPIPLYLTDTVQRMVKSNKLVIFHQLVFLRADFCHVAKQDTIIVRMKAIHGTAISVMLCAVGGYVLI